MKHGIENIDAESTANKRPKLEKKLPELLQEIREGRTEDFRHFIDELPVETQQRNNSFYHIILKDLRIGNPNAFKAPYIFDLEHEKLDEQTALLMTQILNDSKVNNFMFRNNDLNKNTIATIINTLKNNEKNEFLSFKENIEFNIDTANVIATALRGAKFTALAFNSNTLGDQEAITIAKAIKEESHIKCLLLDSDKLSAQGILSVLHILQGSSVIMLWPLRSNLVAKELMSVDDYTKILTEVLKHNIRHLDLMGCKMDIDSLNAWATAIKQSSIKTFGLPEFAITDNERINFVKHLVDSPVTALGLAHITNHSLRQLFAPLKESKIVALDYHCPDITEETHNELNSILSINRLKSERANAMLSSFYLSKLERAEPLVTQTASIPKMGT